MTKMRPLASLVLCVLIGNSAAFSTSAAFSSCRSHKSSVGYLKTKRICISASIPGMDKSQSDDKCRFARSSMSVGGLAGSHVSTEALVRCFGSLFSVSLVSFGLLSNAVAFTPDLAGSPLEKANAQIVVEGSARVVDGDTIVIETTSGQKERIRLLGIDAPESKQLCQDKAGASYSCGLEAKQTLERIVGRDPVKCVAAKRDQYSRVLGVCFDEKTGQELNKELVVEGEAIAYQQYSKAYVKQEEGAKLQGRGVWKGNFQKPWEYRKEKRSASKQGKLAPQPSQAQQQQSVLAIDDDFSEL